jgi:hypothetical protein
MKHIVSKETMDVKIFNLVFDSDGFIEIDTFYFTEALIHRALREEKRLNRPNYVKNLVNQLNSESETPFMIAIIEDRLDMLKLLMPFAQLGLRKEVKI